MLSKVKTMALNGYTKAFVALIGVQALIISPAYAGSTSSMPWDTPVQGILSDVTGPLAKAIGVLLIFGFGIGLAFSESGGMLRKALGIVLGISIAFAAGQWGLTFFGYSGGAAL